MVQERYACLEESIRGNKTWLWGSLSGSADDLADPVAASAHGVEGQVARALVDGAYYAETGVPEAVDELFAGRRMGEDAHVQALRRPVLHNPHLQ